MIVKALTEHHLEFLSLKGGCRGSSKSINVKMPHCWKSHSSKLYLGVADAGEGLSRKDGHTYVVLVR